MNGFVVGCGEPPCGSTVTATTAPDGICLLSFTTVVPAPPSNVPAGEADLPATTHASYVLPAGARSRPATTSAPVPPGPTTTEPVAPVSGTPRRALVWSFSCRCRETFQTARPITAHAAIAAAAASGAAQRGRSGTTFGRSA